MDEGSDPDLVRAEHGPTRTTSHRPSFMGDNMPVRFCKVVQRVRFLSLCRLQPHQDICWFRPPETQNQGCIITLTPCTVLQPITKLCAETEGLRSEEEEEKGCVGSTLGPMDPIPAKHLVWTRAQSCALLPITSVPGSNAVSARSEFREN